MVVIARAWALARAVYWRHAERYLRVGLKAPQGVTADLIGGRLEVRIANAHGTATLALDGAAATAMASPTGQITLSVRAPQGAGPALLTGSCLAAPVVIPAPTAAQRRLARLRHSGLFVRQLCAAVPALARVALQPRNATRLIALREAIGLSRVAQSGDLDPARLSPLMSVRGAPDRPIVLVLPVYNAFDLLPEALDRIAAHTDIPYRLIVIEDASTDAAIRPWLRGRISQFPLGTAHLIENAQNIGFVKSANLGLADAVASGAHAVLLNTDSFVPTAWASRLMAPIVADPAVASVTPWSGASGLTTVPAIGPGAPTPSGVADHLDQIAQAHSGQRTADLPTGMGFCMAMNAAFLRRLPHLDPTFCTGYGEETDWCQRASALGGGHLAHLGLFVDHSGSASFGKLARDRLAAEAAAILRTRYPTYEAAVTRFVDDDPLLTERLALGIARLGALAGRVSVYLAHSLGGGAESDLRARISADCANDGGAIVLRVGGTRAWRVEVHGAGHPAVSGLTDDAAFVARLIHGLPLRRIIYSCAVGAPDPLSVPRLLLALLTAPDDRLEVLLHDYFPLSPSFTLLDSDGWFRGVPDAGTTDTAHLAHGPDGVSISLGAWRAAWGALIDRADRVVAFSKPSADIVRAVWPEAAIVVDPHTKAPAQVITPGGQVLGILGNISRQKGAEVVSALAKMRPDLRIACVGTFDAAQPRHRNLKVLGPYQADEIGQIAQREGIGAWLIPSIWPETHCFTLHEALGTGLPTIGFDLGAVGATLRRAHGDGQQAYAVKCGASPSEAAAAVDAILRQIFS